MLVNASRRTPVVKITPLRTADGANRSPHPVGAIESVPRIDITLKHQENGAVDTKISSFMNDVG